MKKVKFKFKLTWRIWVFGIVFPDRELECSWSHWALHFGPLCLVWRRVTREK